MWDLFREFLAFFHNEAAFEILILNNFTPILNHQIYSRLNIEGICSQGQKIVRIVNLQSLFMIFEDSTEGRLAKILRQIFTNNIVKILFDTFSAELALLWSLRKYEVFYNLKILMSLTFISRNLVFLNFVNFCPRIFCEMRYPTAKPPLLLSDKIFS